MCYPVLLSLLSNAIRDICKTGPDKMQCVGLEGVHNLKNPKALDTNPFSCFQYLLQPPLGS